MADKEVKLKGMRLDLFGCAVISALAFVVMEGRISTSLADDAAVPPAVDSGAVTTPGTEASVPPSGGTEASSGDSAPAAPDASPLEKVIEGRQTGHFSGKPITLQVRNADIGDILRLISEASGFNIVMGDDVKGKLTISLVDVPWDQALDVVLHTMKLGAERNNNLLRVVTLTSLTQEKQQEVQAKNAAMAASPRVMKIFPISYADPNALMQLLQKFGSVQTASGGPLPPGLGTASSSSSTNTTITTANTTTIQVDLRTNSIVVQDIPENIEKMAKLIKILDTATPQVLIDAKVIEATEDFSKTLGGSIGAGGTGSNQFFGGFNGSNPIDPLIGSPGVFANGAAIAAGNTSSFGFSPNLSFIPGLSRLNAVLSMGETENNVKVITSPKLVVLNKQSASVTQSTPVGLPQNTVSNGTVSQTIQVAQANISLNVTPTVTNDGSVQLQLNLERDVPATIAGATSGQAVATRNLQTQVLVDSGSTLVIGGVYSMQVTHSASGFPVLRNIPILGFLFGNTQDDTQRSELFFFITPRILNPKEAGLAAN